MEQQPINTPERDTKRVITLSNGDTFVFPSKFKGKHRRGLEKIRMSIDKAEDYPDKYPEIIKLMMESAKDKEGKNLNIDNNYLDDLEFEDYLELIDNGIQDFVIELSVPKVSKEN